MVHSPVSYFPHEYAVGLALLATGCAWAVSLSTEIFLSDGATRKSIRRGLGKVVFSTLATFSAIAADPFFTTLSFLIASCIHLSDMKAMNSRWMAHRIDRLTSVMVLSAAFGCGYFIGHEPLFFASISAIAAVFHIFKMRRRQQEFFQNFQLLRDRMATLEAQRLAPRPAPILKPVRGYGDNHSKAG